MFTSANRSVIRSALIAAAVIASTAGAAEAAKVGTMSSGAWKGSVFTNDDTGVFSHCVFAKDYPNGMRLMFGVAADKSWSFGMANRNWQLKKGQRRKVRYRVDSEDIRSGTALVKNDIMAQVQLPLDKRLVNWLMDGDQFHVKTGKSHWSFDLGKSRTMLRKLFACAKDNIQKASATPERNEFEAEEAPGFETREAFAGNDDDRSPQTRKEGRTAVNYMLKLAGVTGETVSREEQPTLVKLNDVVWKMKGMIGAFRILPSRSLTPKEIGRQIRASDLGTCKGKFGANQVTEPSRAAYDFITVCDDVEGKNGERALSAYYLVQPRREGGHYLTMIIGPARAAEQVRAMGAHLRSAAVELNAKGSVPGARPVS